MLSFFTVALIGLFVLMTWFETPAEPPVRHPVLPEEEPDEIDSVERREAA